MAVTVKVDDSSLFPNGQRFIRGHINMSATYLTSGDTMDLSSYFTGSPTVVIAAGAMTLKHNQGTAAAGKVLAYRVDNTNINGIASNIPLVQVANAADLSAQTLYPFFAVGLAF